MVSDFSKERSNSILNISAFHQRRCRVGRLPAVHHELCLRIGCNLPHLQQRRVTAALPAALPAAPRIPTTTATLNCLEDAQRRLCCRKRRGRAALQVLYFCNARPQKTKLRPDLQRQGIGQDTEEVTFWTQ